MTTIPDAAETVNAEPGVTHHAYPASAMAGDYLRAAAGLVPTGILLSSVPLATVSGVVLASLAAIFALFAARTVLRHRCLIEMSETELRASGLWPRSIAWTALDRFKLGYYSTRRDRRAGWMQLELGVRGTRLRLDSRIGGFDAVVRRAASTAFARGLELSPTTLANLQALGIRAHDAGSWR